VAKPEPKPERVYQRRELRAVDAVAMGLIGGGFVGIIITLLTSGLAPVSKLLAFGAMMLGGGALKLRVLQEHKRTTQETAKDVFE